jgi:processive 1,2-diacylglycerol beta-glucosyltransferase
MARTVGGGIQGTWNLAVHCCGVIALQSHKSAEISCMQSHIHRASRLPPHGRPGSGFAPRVLLLTSGLGQGHTRVAHAIAAGLVQQSIEAETLDLWSLMNPGVVSIVHHTYLRLVQEYPELYERLYQLDEHTWRQILESESGPPAAVLEVLELIASIAADASSPEVRSLRFSSDRLLLALLCTALPYDGASLGGNGVKARLALLKWTWLRLVKRLETMIRAASPDIIVCTQMIPAAMVSSLKQRRKFHVPTIGVLTDFGVHDFWIQAGVDRYCVAHDSMLPAFDADRRRADVVVTGVPLMPAFAQPLSQPEARRQLHLPLQGPLVLVLGGGLGLGVDAVASRLLEPASSMQVLVMPGRNNEAQLALAKLSAAYPDRLRVGAWTERMDIHMRAADIVVGKPGGVTVAEVLACGRPLFATRSLGGQEGFNVNFLERHGVGALVRDHELFERVRSTLARPDELAATQVRAWALGHRNGTRHASDLILDLSWAARTQAARIEH